MSKDERFIIINVSGNQGFIPNCLQIFKMGTTSRDHHSEIKGTNYEKLLQEKLIPNLTPRSVVVADNVPYHNVQINKAPNMVILFYDFHPTIQTSIQLN
ncbi:uncharacterized protein BDFB_008072, partial [Asbolus verrucosus]